MRLFVAVVPPADVVTSLDSAVGPRDEQLRWVPSTQWHVTLVFCGEATESVVPELTERLARAAARTDPPSLRLAGAGTFPKQAARARVLWVGLDGDTAALRLLADRCGAAAGRCGIDVEDRRFRSHLTLARARHENVDLSAHVARLSLYAGEPWQVPSIRLVHSTLGARVHHETLAEFPLARPVRARRSPAVDSARAQPTSR